MSVTCQDSEKHVLFRHSAAPSGVFELAHALHWPKASSAKRRKGEQIMANGEFQVTITAQSGGGYTFVGNDISTQGAVTLALDGNGGFALTAAQGIYAFIFSASNFQFADPALTWSQPSANRNLTWMSKDNTLFAVTNINFVTNQQSVNFTINPDQGTSIDVNIPAGSLLPIDPTVLNNPLPGGGVPLVLPSPAASVQEAVMAG
jgi:hypothetical protein